LTPRPVLSFVRARSRRDSRLRSALAGTQLGEAAQFIEDFRAGFIGLRKLVENALDAGSRNGAGFLFDLLDASASWPTDGNGPSFDDVIIEGRDAHGRRFLTTTA